MPARVGGVAMPVTSIPPHLPFLETLAQQVLASRQALDQTWVLLPSRRNCRAFAQLLVEHSSRRGLVLPRIFPLGDVDEDALGFLDAMSASVPSIPPAMGRIERWMRVAALLPSSPLVLEHQRLSLARALCDVMDTCARAGVPLQRLETVVPERYAAHWQTVLSVLKIVIHEWPSVCETLGMESPVVRRNQCVAALIEQWRTHPPEHPIIAAGSTASTKATADLLHSIAGLPQGTVVLPGLAQVDATYWAAVDAAHPYYFLKSAAPAVHSPPPPHPRTQLFLQALAPPEAITRWRETAVDLAAATQGLRFLEAEHAWEEARMVALVVREALEDPATTVMVVTEARTHAMRLVAALEQHGIVTDTSHGTPLLETPPVVFLRLVLACAQSPGAGTLLALLHHPYARAGVSRAACLEAARAIDRAMRGPAQADAFAALIDHPHLDVNTRATTQKVQAMLAPLQAALQRPYVSAEALYTLHLETAEALAEELWKGERGKATAAVIATLRTHVSRLGSLHGALYMATFEELLAQEYYRGPYGTHPRVAVLSAQEARLLTADVVIIAGMADGVFPARTQANPWMGRHMMETVGLHVPETTASRTAHDLLMLSHARQLVLSTAAKIDGIAVAPSGYLTRLKLYLQSQDAAVFASVQDTRTRALLEQLDAAAPRRTSAPAPVPPRALRPSRVTVSDVQMLRRDPYAFYARYILRLTPLEPLEKMPDATLFGTVMHRVLEEFAQAEPTPERFWRAAEEALRPMRHHPAVVALWHPRMARLMHPLVRLEQERRDQVASVHAEIPLEMQWGEVTLRTRIDRLETARDGTCLVVDYKTHTPPSQRSVANAETVQLPLMAMVVETALQREVTAVGYWNVSGRAAITPQMTPYNDALRNATKEGFEALMHHFLREDTAYTAPAGADIYPVFEHLTRRDEWV